MVGVVEIWCIRIEHTCIIILQCIIMIQVILIAFSPGKSNK